MALNEPLFGISMIMQSVFNGIGNTKPPLYVSAFTQWVFRVGGTFLTVSILGLGIEAAWLCMITDNIMRAVLLSYCYIRQNSQLIISMELKNT